MMDGLRDGRRTPDLVDGLAFYGANAVSTALQDCAARELKSRRISWLTVGLSIVGVMVAEEVKADINRTIYPPFSAIVTRENSVE